MWEAVALWCDVGNAPLEACRRATHLLYEYVQLACYQHRAMFTALISLSRPIALLLSTGRTSISCSRSIILLCLQEGLPFPL